MTKRLAYCFVEEITTVKSFKIEAPTINVSLENEEFLFVFVESNLVKPFTSVIYEFL
jgi:hypothetical protein